MSGFTHPSIRVRLPDETKKKVGMRLFSISCNRLVQYKQALLYIGIKKYFNLGNISIFLNLHSYFMKRDDVFGGACNADCCNVLY